MISNLRPASRRHLIHLLFTLLCLTSLSQTRAQGESAEGSGTDSGCGAGHKYVDGNCVIDYCQLDCEDEPTHKVCASNAQTFRNKCEFEKWNCENDEDKFIIYEDSCVTVPPPPEEICLAKKNIFYDLPNDEYNRICNLETLTAKAANNTLSIKDDLIPCYDPSCTNDGKFTALQCSYNVPGWCWCANSEGRPLSDKPQQGLKTEHCEAALVNQRSCMDSDNFTYLDGELFPPESYCGVCECLDGNITCFDHYTPGIDGRITDEQVDQLKEELIQLFYLQYTHQEHIEIDIRHVHRNPINIHPRVKKTMLAWKFDFYDRTNNNVLTPGEIFLFYRDLDNFLHCNSFINQIIDLISADDIINIFEWEKFFGVDLQATTTTSSTAATGSAGSTSSSTQQLSKRSAPSSERHHQQRLNRLQKRKKFYYYLE